MLITLEALCCYAVTLPSKTTRKAVTLVIQNSASATNTAQKITLQLVPIARNDGQYAHDTDAELCPTK